MTRGTSNSILRQVELLGYAVSVHEMPGYVELHAVRLGDDGVPRVARCEGELALAVAFALSFKYAPF